MTSGLARALLRLGFLLVVAVVAGCATPEATRMAQYTAGNTWTGRLLLKADTAPPTQFSAVFELNGSEERGRLALSTPLGTTLAAVLWQPGLAELRGTGPVKHFADLNALTEALTGTRLPVAALFAWLKGVDADADGWQADLSGLSNGKLTARRLPPLPWAEIRLVLDTSSQLQP